MADWEKIRREYVAGGTTAKRLAEKYGVPVATIYNHSRQERWVEEQKLHAETVRKKYAQKSAADIENIKRRIDGIVAKLAERADTIAGKKRRSRGKPSAEAGMRNFANSMMPNTQTGSTWTAGSRIVQATPEDNSQDRKNRIHWHNHR